MPACRGQQLTTDEINSRFTAVHLRLLTPYQNAHAPVTVRCHKCRHTYKVRPYGVFQGQGCARCNKYRPPTLTADEVATRLQRVGVELRSVYRDSSHRVKVRCNQCHHSWKVFPTSLFQGHGCAQCAWDDEARRRHSQSHKRAFRDPTVKRRHARAMRCEETRSKMRADSQDIERQCRRLGLRLLTAYKGRDYPLKVECRQCRHQWRVTTAVAVLRSKGCPVCHPHRFGVSEDRARKIVERVTGWKFPRANPSWLKGRGRNALQLDGYNSRHQVAFEYQGRQHYEVRADLGGEEALVANKRRDERKRLLCLRHGVLLIRIPYWKQDVAEFVRAKLAQLER